MRFSQILVVNALLLLSSTVAAQQQSFQNLTVNGEARRYLLYLPTNFDPAENLPVMMWFHAGGGNANGALFEADFRSLANTERFIAVYTEAIPDVLEACYCWVTTWGVKPTVTTRRIWRTPAR